MYCIGQSGGVLFFRGREKIDQLFSNHALESDDKEESEYASPMIIITILQSIISIIIPTTSTFTFHRKPQPI